MNLPVTRFTKSTKSIRLLIICFLSAFLSLTAVGQVDLKSMNGKTLRAIKVDSVELRGSNHFRLTIQLPKSDSHDLSGNGYLHYRKRRGEHCGFKTYIEVTKDSILLKTAYPESFDPCRGHTDLADMIWEMFGENLKYFYKSNADGTITIYRSGKPMVVLK